MLRFFRKIVQFTSYKIKQNKEIMSKLVIFLCLLVGACTVQGDMLETGKTKVAEMRDKFQELFDVTMKTVLAKVETIKSRYEQVKEQIENKIAEMKKTGEEEMMKFLKSIDVKIEATLNGLKESDQAECAAPLHKIKETVGAMMGNSSLCMVGIMDNSSTHMNTINQLASTMQTQISNLVTESEECCKDMSGMESVWNSFVCLQKTWYKSTKVTVKTIPSILKQMGQVVWEGSLMIPKLTKCSVQAGFVTVTKDLDEIFVSVKSCAAKKLGLYKEAKYATFAPID